MVFGGGTTAFRYTPIDLHAVCDLRQERAEAFARTFGARAALTDHRELLRNPEIEAVQAGKHVWMEKPPAASVGQLIELRQGVCWVNT